jgi:(E)-4-hydroxy-3-methylbut-2-enyl-diphosphate synthase
MKREIFVGGVGIGGRHPVSLQSMTNTPAADAGATLNQIQLLQTDGCQIVRVAVPDMACIEAFKKITSAAGLPVIADIHFDARLALAAIEAGADGIRINPGNIGSKGKLKEILRLANQRKIPIRIGVNYGSIEKKYRPRDGRSISRAEAMVQSLMDWLKFFEDQDFFNIKISAKASDVRETVAAYRLIDRQCDYPLHVGITEAGTLLSGTVKSAVGIGALLLDGIGNTIRVSLTADPREEVRVGKAILQALGLREEGIEIISCPTCSRTSVDLIPLVEEVERRLASVKPAKKITVAVMGCEVNGPGEAADADIGVAFSQHHGFLFHKGRMLEKLPPKKALDRLIELIQNWPSP